MNIKFFIFKKTIALLFFAKHKKTRRKAGFWRDGINVISLSNNQFLCRGLFSLCDFQDINTFGKCGNVNPFIGLNFVG